MKLQPGVATLTSRGYTEHYLIRLLDKLQFLIINSFTKLLQGFFLPDIQSNDIHQCILHL